MGVAEGDLETLRATFLRTYPSIPLNLRGEIIAIIGDNNEPVSWASAYVEVLGKTKKGDEILKHLVESGVLAYDPGIT